MPPLSEPQIAGLKRLFAVANDAVVTNLEAALAEDAASGGAMAAVHRMAADEARERRVRAAVLGPVAPLCRPSSWSPVGFPPATLLLVWTALKESAPAQVEAAVAAHAKHRAGDEPSPAVFDELCLAAAQGLRYEANAFQAANQRLNQACK
ncbi:MAG TPA: hypothetical protein VKT30_09275, partial [Caulobacteraceae bacterium]|nr:hypothetical protein [Caulobacteraceae bacterium]